mmetsp:Transcript_9075/g.13615  ORF Transcript_9075/g.13615 Transcript_9075/m.13615 type:complete len:93 (-) Transcript_9075:1774-2052(-)
MPSYELVLYCSFFVNCLPTIVTNISESQTSNNCEKEHESSEDKNIKPNAIVKAAGHPIEVKNALVCKHFVFVELIRVKLIKHKSCPWIPEKA